MAANRKSIQETNSIMAKATAEIGKRELANREADINKLAEEMGENYVLEILALCADTDISRTHEVKKFLEERPHLLEKMSYLSDDVLDSLSHKIKGGSGSAILIKHEYEAMLKGLTLESDGPLEQMLITRIGLCWLRVMWAENYKSFIMTSRNATLANHEMADKDLTRAHNRHLRAVEALARVRKLVRVAEMADTQAKILKARLNAPPKRGINLKRLNAAVAQAG